MKWRARMQGRAAALPPTIPTRAYLGFGGFAKRHDQMARGRVASTSQGQGVCTTRGGQGPATGGRHNGPLAGVERLEHTQENNKETSMVEPAGTGCVWHTANF